MARASIVLVQANLRSTEQSCQRRFAQDFNVNLCDVF